MLINIGIDAVFGSIPLFGNIFDLFFKANTRNMNLMREYYQAGKHRGSVWPLLIGILLFFLILFAVLIYGMYWIGSHIVGWFSG